MNQDDRGKVSSHSSGLSNYCTDSSVSSAHGRGPELKPRFSLGNEISDK